MKPSYLSSSLAAAAALLAAGGSAAMPAPTPKERAAYLACYRKVLILPEFASLDPASLYAIREARLAKAVVTACRSELGPWRNIIVEAGLRADVAVMAAGGVPPTTAMAVARMDEALRRQIGADLAEADPRVRPIAEADSARPHS